MQPYDYRSKVATPIQKITEGKRYAQRQAIEANQREQAQENQDKSFGFQDRRLNLAENSAAQREQAMTAEVEKANALKQSFAEFGAKANKTPQDYLDFALKHPEQVTEIKSLQGMQSSIQRESNATSAKKLIHALNTGDNKVALDLLDKRIEAAENSGDQATVDKAEAMKIQVEANPEALKDSLKLNLAIMIGGQNAPAFLRELENLESDTDRVDVKRLGSVGRSMGMSQAAINKVLVRNRNKSFEEQSDALYKAAGKTKGKPKKPSKTSSTNMTSLIEYGEELELDRKTINKIASATKGQSIEDRYIALENAAKSPDEPSAKDIAKTIKGNKKKPSGGKKYTVGTRLKNAKGEVITLSPEGKWIKE